MNDALLDTTVLVDYMRERQDAVAFVEALKKAPAASVVSLMELMAGARSRREETEIFLPERTIKFLPVTSEIAKRAGVLLKHYRASHNIDDPDAIIAATAERHGLELATLNVKHFPMFPRLKPPYSPAG